MTAIQPRLADAFNIAAIAAREAGVFGAVETTAHGVDCQAKASAAPAFFRLRSDNGRLWVSLVTTDRYLSQSIEQDLVHTGDKLDDLLEEELVDLGYSPPQGRKSLPFEHFRSEDKLFTFRTPLPLDPAAASAEELGKLAGTFLLGYEACFRRLGDMDADEDDQ